MFKKLSISFKTGLGFALILLVMATEIIFAIQGLQTGSESFRTYRRLARSSVLSGRVQANMLLASRAARDFVQTRDEEYLDIYQERYEASRRFALEQQTTLKDPRRRELSRNLVEQLNKYHRASQELFQLMQRRDEVVQQTLIPQGTQMRMNLSELVEAARQVGDFETAANYGRALEHVLLGRLYLFKFLEENTLADVQRVRDEMNGQEDFDQLAAGVDDRQRQKLLNNFSAARQSWIAAFEELVQIMQQRHALIIQEVQPLDQSIANLSEEVKLSLKADQDRLGPSVQQANTATARAVLIGSLLAFGLAFLIALLFLRAINRSITALGLSEAETERLSREIAARKETERQLASALQEVERVNSLSDIALELTGCGYWHVDYRDPDFYYLSPQAARILGEPWKEDARYHLRDEWLARIQAASPESAELVLERYEGFISERLDNHDATYPYQRPVDGKIIWIHAMGRIVRDEQGEFQHMYGAYQDITRRVEAETSLQNAKDCAEQHAAEMKRSLNAAAKVQQSLLPTSEPETPLIGFAWRYLPCDELAGDFLNFFALDDQHIAVYMIDVSGHGVASSLLSVTIGRMMTPQVSSTSLLVQRTEANAGSRILLPSEVASKLNRRFPMAEQNDLFFTMMYGVLNLKTRQFRYVSAGHEPLVLMSRTEPPRIVESSGLAIGWFEDAEYEDHEITLQPGDRLYVYSDGVPEAINENIEPFSTETMKQVIENGRSRSLDQSVSFLVESVRDWCGDAGLRDDVSIIGMEMSGES